MPSADKPLSPSERDELGWWRTFACRFQGSNLPKPGEPLYGYRFRLYVDEKGNYVPWGEVPEAMPTVEWHPDSDKFIEATWIANCGKCGTRHVIATETPEEGRQERPCPT